MINASTGIVTNICRSMLLTGFFALLAGPVFPGDGETVAQKSSKLSHKDTAIRARAAEEIIVMDAAAGTPAVIAALRRERNPAVKRDMINALGRSGRPEARTEVRQYLAADDAELRLEAAGALAQMGSAEGVRELGSVARTVTADKGWRSYAIRSLGSVATDESADELAPLLRDPDPAIRLQAVAALDRVRTPQARQRILALSGDPDEAVRDLVKRIAQRKPRK